MQAAQEQPEPPMDTTSNTASVPNYTSCAVPLGSLVPLVRAIGNNTDISPLCRLDIGHTSLHVCIQCFHKTATVHVDVTVTRPRDVHGLDLQMNNKVRVTETDCIVVATPHLHRAIKSLMNNECALWIRIIGDKLELGNAPFTQVPAYRRPACAVQALYALPTPTERSLSTVVTWTVPGPVLYSTVVGLSVASKGVVECTVEPVEPVTCPLEQKTANEQVQVTWVAHNVFIISVYSAICKGSFIREVSAQPEQEEESVSTMLVAKHLKAMVAPVQRQPQATVDMTEQGALSIGHTIGGRVRVRFVLNNMAGTYLDQE